MGVSLYTREFLLPKPANLGSQTYRVNFCNAFEKASEDCCGVPPAASTAAAAAIAEALPTSA